MRLQKITDAPSYNNTSPNTTAGHLRITTKDLHATTDHLHGSCNTQPSRSNGQPSYNNIQPLYTSIVYLRPDSSKQYMTDSLPRERQRSVVGWMLEDSQRGLWSDQQAICHIVDIEDQRSHSSIVIDDNIGRRFSGYPNIGWMNCFISLHCPGSYLRGEGFLP